MTRRRPKKNIKASSLIESIPHDLLCEVLGRVGASSLTDVFNVKLSCKALSEITEDRYIYQCISLEKFPIVHWKPLNEKQKAFLNKCQDCGNPESLYRQAVLDYFNKTNLESTCRNLEKALKSGHAGALYVACIVLLMSGEDESKQKGIRLMGHMRKSKSSRKKLIVCRNNLREILEKIWVKNPLLKGRPRLCTTQHRRHWTSRWPDEEEADDACEACSADREISYTCDRYNWG